MHCGMSGRQRSPRRRIRSEPCCRGRGLVEEHECVGIEVGHGVKPGPGARLSHLRAPARPRRQPIFTGGAVVDEEPRRPAHAGLQTARRQGLAHLVQKELQITLTPKRAAPAWRDAPSATTAATRSRRSINKGDGIGRLLRPPTRQIRPRYKPNEHSS